MSLVNTDDVTKRKLLYSLKDILRLMALAKEIIQSKIDDSLVYTAKINKFEDIQLPAQVDQGLETFFGTLHDNMHVSENAATEIIDELGASEVTLQNANVGYSDEDLQATAAKSEEILHKGIDVCQQMIELQKQKINTESAKIHYERELERLKNHFQNQYKDLVSQSYSILDIMAELNTANTSDEVRNALLKLSDGKLDIPSDEELEEFMKGNKQITV